MKTIIHISNKIKNTYPNLIVHPLHEVIAMEDRKNTWNAHITFVHRKKCWVITHVLMRYTVITPDFTTASLSQFRELFIYRLTSQLLAQNKPFDSQKIEQLIGQVVFSPTNGDRSCIAFINQRIQELEYLKNRYEIFQDIPFSNFGAAINQIGTKNIDGKLSYISPYDELMQFIGNDCFQ